MITKFFSRAGRSQKVRTEKETGGAEKDEEEGPHDAGASSYKYNTNSKQIQYKTGTNTIEIH